MKIVIKDADTNLNLRLPSRLILNSITAALAPRIINKKIKESTDNDFKQPITSSQLRTLIREINRYRRKHRDWVLIEVGEESTGERVVIKP